MPALVLWIGTIITWVFRTKIGSFIASALLFFGLSIGSQKFLVAPFLQQIQSLAGGLSGDAVGWLAFFNLDKYITIILSAYATASASRVFIRKRSA